MLDFIIQYSEIITIVVVLFMVLPSIVNEWRRKRISIRKNKSSLLSMIAANKMFNSITLRTPDGHRILQVLSESTITGLSSHTLYMLDLPFQSKAHLLGIPTGYNINPPSFKKDRMEPVVLEGDYPSYFHLFAELNQQVESRYILDPKTMVFTIDFCRDFLWEIQDSTLYFASKQVGVKLELIDRFIKEIQPAIQTKNLNLNHPNKLSYTHRSLQTINCPICQALLIGDGEFLECPEGHGLLLTGRELRRLRQEGYRKTTYKPPSKPRNIERRENKLPCPYCKTIMKTSLVEYHGVTIDICAKCGYRWLDGDKLETISGLRDPDRTVSLVK